ncbi:hypothetical protein ACLOJK_011626 [Asimina triloba]
MAKKAFLPRWISDDALASLGPAPTCMHGICRQHTRPMQSVTQQPRWATCICPHNIPHRPSTFVYQQNPISKNPTGFLGKGRPVWGPRVRGAWGVGRPRVEVVTHVKFVRGRKAGSKASSIAFAREKKVKHVDFAAGNQGGAEKSVISHTARSLRHVLSQVHTQPLDVIAYFFTHGNDQVRFRKPSLSDGLRFAAVDT